VEAGKIGVLVNNAAIAFGQRNRSLTRHRPRNKLGNQKCMHSSFRGLWTSMVDYLFAASRITSATS
jgi:hypothetical protein